ncbi:hypothetical protein P7K49_039395, partial [Saguinus oedipus]
YPSPSSLPHQAQHLRLSQRNPRGLALPVAHLALCTELTAALHMCSPLENSRQTSGGFPRMALYLARCTE